MKCKVGDNWASEASPTLGCSIEILHDILLASKRSERDTLRSVQSRIADIYILVRANFVLITRKEGGA